MNDKIQPHHFGRKAVLYVRQSSSYQSPTTVSAARCSMPCRIGCGH